MVALDDVPEDLGKVHASQQIDEQPGRKDELDDEHQRAVQRGLLGLKFGSTPAPDVAFERIET
jgi:hypothetical protein